MLKHVSKKRLGTVLLIVVFALSVFLLQISSHKVQAASKKVKIRFAHTWTGSDSKAKYFEPLLNKYINSMKDKADFVIETAAGDDMRTKIKVEVAAGNAPDVFTYWGGGSILKPLVDANIVLDISQYLKDTKKLKKSDISDSAWAFYTFNGKPYGIPVEGYKSAFIVNKELFNKYNLKYPKTYDELKKVATVFNKNGIVPLAVGSNGGNPSHFFFSELYCQYANGIKEIINLGSTYKFDTSNAIKVAKLIEDMKKNKIFPKDTMANGGWDGSFALYNNGKAAMVYTYPWMFGQMTSEMLKKSELISIPKMPGATKDPATFVSSSSVFGLVVSNKSYNDKSKKEILINFLDFLTSDQVISEMVKGSMVPVKKVKLDQSKINPLLLKVLNFNNDKEEVPSHFTTMPDANAFTTFQSSLDELFAGAITADKFVKKVQLSLDKAKKK